MLSELLDVSEADSEAIAAANYLNKKQRDEKMTDLYNDYKNWKTVAVRASKNAAFDHVVTKVGVTSDAWRFSEFQVSSRNDSSKYAPFKMVGN